MNFTGDGEEGEVVKEQVQTWICDNQLDVTRVVSTTLHAKEISFGTWFRLSKENRSPDELVVYCLSKMTSKHTVILNKSFAWSTLRNYMSYSDVEIMQRSSVVLIYVDMGKYAILKPSWTVKTPEASPLHRLALGNGKLLVRRPADRQGNGPKRTHHSPTQNR